MTSDEKNERLCWIVFLVGLLMYTVAISLMVIRNPELGGPAVSNTRLVINGFGFPQVERIE